MLWRLMQLAIIGGSVWVYSVQIPAEQPGQHPNAWGGALIGVILAACATGIISWFLDLPLKLRGWLRRRRPLQQHASDQGARALPSRQFTQTIEASRPTQKQVRKLLR
jgi:hypothetical protein